MKKILVILGIGSNLGNRKKNIHSAIELLCKHKKIHIIQVSKLLKNPPQEGLIGPYFLNGAIKLETSLGPRELVSFCKSIEKSLGRKKTHGPNKTSRTIDLDILFYGNKIINTKTLKIPHPKLHKRNFVLIPLKEIAGDFVHPVLKKSIKELHSHQHNKLSKCSTKVHI